MSRQIHSPQSATRGVRIERGILPIWRKQMHRVENRPSLDTRIIECPHHSITLGLTATSQHYGLHPEHGACPGLGRLRHQLIGEPLQL